MRTHRGRADYGRAFGYQVELYFEVGVSRVARVLTSRKRAVYVSGWRKVGVLVLLRSTRDHESTRRRDGDAFATHVERPARHKSGCAHESESEGDYYY